MESKDASLELKMPQALLNGLHRVRVIRQIRVIRGWLYWFTGILIIFFWIA